MTRRTPDIQFSDLELVHAFLASSAPTGVERIEEECLVRYAFGWSSESDEERVLDALTHSRSLRRDLIRIRESLMQPETRSTCVKEFLDYAIAFAASTLSALERGVSDWKSSIEGNLVVEHALSARSSRLANLPGNIAWARSRSAAETISADDGSPSVMVDTDSGTPALLPIFAGPAVRDGEIELELEFDPQFLREHADRMLALSFAAGPLRVPLKAWKVTELPTNGRLSAPIPSSLAGPVPRAAIELSLCAG